ncbi:Heptaprenyl diphosphate synthase component II [Candidatus Syntrophocurvum alkaliphilum]|uniref:Heptaprenyl diphosphate synthase component II n=1 Tax=Candidatus Syntrophocurvum alkaliphilum TaxID=2293317 RepID=A0A6I6D7B9_9FIRM|nr:polyprenyl synthetase family protein [Candidatus Syntrophocurvum alkaliphilum]QGT99046.1 Heptaprenyl diphosphate synthase component II [Candidatus Syntrophocurvum alkaliphilum]
MVEFDFFYPISRELDIIEEDLSKHIDTNVSLLMNASTHLVKAGGKRLRPAFTLLTAKLYSNDLEDVIPMAVALELIHMATLVHDDVIDNSDTRRGADTVKKNWGNRLSLYSGNFVFARSLSLIASYNRSDLVDVLADASMRICEGEIYQMLSSYNTEQSLKDYLRRIERKTALLISVSCQLGAMIKNAKKEEVLAIQRYGYYLGMAFQITDDILDFIADEQTLGKPTGSDIRQGVITLPALFALKHDSRKKELKYLLTSPELCQRQADRIIDIVTNSHGIDYAYNVTNKYSIKAKEQLRLLPNCELKDTLASLTDFISARDF